MPAMVVTGCAARVHAVAPDVPLPSMNAIYSIAEDDFSPSVTLEQQSRKPKPSTVGQQMPDSSRSLHTGLDSQVAVTVVAFDTVGAADRDGGGETDGAVVGTDDTVGAADMVGAAEDVGSAVSGRSPVQHCKNIPSWAGVLCNGLLLLLLLIVCSCSCCRRRRRGQRKHTSVPKN